MCRSVSAPDPLRPDDTRIYCTKVKIKFGAGIGIYTYFFRPVLRGLSPGRCKKRATGKIFLPPASLSCGATGNRTRDTRIFSPLLYQLSYGTSVELRSKGTQKFQTAKLSIKKTFGARRCRPFGCFAGSQPAEGRIERSEISVLRKGGCGPTDSPSRRAETNPKEQKPRPAPGYINN